MQAGQVSHDPCSLCLRMGIDISQPVWYSKVEKPRTMIGEVR